MVKPGGKKSKTVMFEAVDFEQIGEEESAISFMTNENNLPLWISCFNEKYMNHSMETTCDIIWSYAQHHSKLLAQVKEKIVNNRQAPSSKNKSLSFSLGAAQQN